MTRRETFTSPSAPRPTAAEVSESLAHVDRALLLGGGLSTGLAIAAMWRARSATPLLGAVTLGAAALALALRLGRRSGATAAELCRALPGDGLIPHPRLVTDRALTIWAPATEIWPWIVQMGYHRGGWYTNRRVDTLLWHIDNP